MPFYEIIIFVEFEKFDEMEIYTKTKEFMRTLGHKVIGRKNMQRLQIYHENNDGEGVQVIFYRDILRIYNILKSEFPSDFKTIKQHCKQYPPTTKVISISTISEKEYDEDNELLHTLKRFISTNFSTILRPNIYERTIYNES